MSDHYDCIIVGAGLAGLSAALKLESYNLKPLIIEASDRVGGRIKTDEYEGFRLDHGFQVLLEGYPKAAEFFDYQALDLKQFDKGAYCYSDYEGFYVNDGANLFQAAKMAFSPVGDLGDKIKLFNLKNRLQKESLDEIFHHPEMPTAKRLKKLGFSDKIIRRFFKPFLSGIFLEKDLSTSSRMFEFVFKLFSEAPTSIPSLGMEELPKQLKAGLKRTEFLFHTEVELLKAGHIKLKNGETLTSKQIICTVPNLLAQSEDVHQWHRTATYYFSADKAFYTSRKIGLNYNSEALVNNFAVLSNVSKDYAPKGKHLIALSLKHIPNESEEEMIRQLKNEMALIFGPQVQTWKFLKSYHIKKALPQMDGLAINRPFEESRMANGLYQAGDYLLNPSINGALQSGENAAKALILNYKTNA